MLQRLRRRALPGVVLALLLAALGLPAAADPGSELERIHDRKARIQAERAEKEAQAADVDERVRLLDQERARAEAKVDTLDIELAAVDADIDKAKRKLTAAQQELALLAEELDGLEGRLDHRTDLLTTRAVEAYKAGPAAYLDSLLSSVDFTDLVDRVAYQESAMDADAELLDQIGILKDETEAREDLAEEKKLEIAEAKLALERDRDALEVKRHERAQILAAKEAVLSEKRSLLAELRRDASELAKLEAQLASDEASLVAAIQSAGSSAGPLPTGGGQLLMPAAGPVTSPYGYRTHPIFGDQRLHTGVDIGAGYGAPVVAADDGTVVYVGVMSGYGNVIAIDHGGGLATTYNHLSAFYIGSGQSVSRGSRIGAVGCTGYCTGPHLHFEVRVNGSPVDPMPYLQ